MRRVAVMTGALCAVVCLVAGGECAARAWYIRTVERGPAEDFAFGTSLALDASGHPHISYADWEVGALRYAAWNGSSWSIQTVDTDPWIGECTSIAVDSAGRPYIAYCRDAAPEGVICTTWNGSTWERRQVDPDGWFWGTRPLALDTSGNPHVVYIGHGGLIWAAWNGSSWDYDYMDSTSGAFDACSIAMDANGYAHTSYWHHKDDTVSMRYSVSQGAGGQVETVDSDVETSSPIWWWENSLALDANGLPRLSYYDEVNWALKYAASNGASWVIQTVDADVGPGGVHNCLALDTSGYPHITYHDAGWELKYAMWDGSTWQIERVEGAGINSTDTGWYNSLALDSAGDAHIAYIDWDNGYVRYATTRPFAEASHELSAAGYYMISLPLTPPPGTTVHEVLCDDLGCGDYYMWRWDGGRYYAVRTSWPGCQYPTLSSQRGYWVLAPAATLDINVGGTLATGDQVIPLRMGWNMIGAPYEAPMDSLLVDNAGDVRSLADAESAGWVLGTFYYSNDGTGTYESVAIGQAPPERLSLWHGYWVLAALDCSLIIPDPSIGGGTSAGPRQAAPPAIAWAFDLEARNGNATDSITIAVSDSASDGFDGFTLDKPKPPAAPGEGALRMALTGVGRGCLSPPASAASPLPATSELAMETKGAAKAESEWYFTVTGGANGEPVTLSWPELNLLPKDRVAALCDLDTGTRTFMRTRAQYEFAAPGPGATRDFSVSVKPAQQAGLRISSFSIVPLRGGRGAEIAFSLSGEATVDIRILNVAGRLVQRVRDAYTVEAGTHTVAWDGRSLGGTALPNGTYLCILEGRTPEGEQASAVRALRVVR